MVAATAFVPLPSRGSRSAQDPDPVATFEHEHSAEVRWFFCVGPSSIGMKSTFGAFANMMAAGIPQGNIGTSDAAHDAMIRMLGDVGRCRRIAEVLYTLTREEQECLRHHYGEDQNHGIATNIGLHARACASYIMAARTTDGRRRSRRS